MEIRTNNRLLSLDVFRGMTVIGMILVNNPGDGNFVYSSLEHAKWDGCTLADMVFPFFLFIVGVSVALSFAGRIERGADTKELFFKILKRSILLFIAGMFLGGYPFVQITADEIKWIGFSNLKFPGILPRIAIIYFITSVIFLKAKPKTIAIIAGSILLFYWGSLSLVPVPGLGHASLDPGTNLGFYFDKMLLGGIFPKTISTEDSGGLLSTLPAISNSLFGVLLGYWLRKKDEVVGKVVWIFVVGIFSLVAGIIWDIWFPINKSLWTSSFVLYTTGLGLQLFAFLYWFADVLESKWWCRPFIVYGTNALFVYFISVVFSRSIKQLIFFTDSAGIRMNMKDYLFRNFIAPLFSSPFNSSAAWASLIVLFWFCILSYLYKKNIFIKL